MGVGGPSFDEDDELIGNSNDDEDLQKDPISLIDLRVAFCFVFRKGSAVTDDSVAGTHRVFLEGERRARCGWVWGACGTT